MKAGNGGPKVGKDSPTGDLHAKNDMSSMKFFGRKIKNAGPRISASGALRVRPFQTAGGDNAL